MGGGGGTQKTTTETKLPPWMEEAYKQALSLSEDRAKMGYVPYIGPDLAAFTQPTVQAMQSQSDTANLFGMGPQQNIQQQLMPATDFGNGISGYSSFPGYLQAQSNLGAKYPGLKSYLDSFFINPETGQLAPGGPWDRAKVAANSKSGSSGSGSTAGLRPGDIITSQKNYRPPIEGQMEGTYRPQNREGRGGAQTTRVLTSADFPQTIAQILTAPAGPLPQAAPNLPSYMNLPTYR